MTYAVHLHMLLKTYEYVIVLLWYMIEFNILQYHCTAPVFNFVIIL